MSASEDLNLSLDVNLDDLDAEEVNEFLQEGQRGMPEYAASCETDKELAALDDTTINNTTIINNSCSQASPESIVDEIDL